MQSAQSKEGQTLSARFSLLTAIILIAALAAFIPWSLQRQQAVTEQNALNEARTLSQQMDAAWQYIDAIQPIINYDATGRYEFKHVYCATAAKAIAHNFVTLSDYTIRYVRENPRVSGDAPDRFEAQALASFDRETSEYSGTALFEEKPVFRYVVALTVEANCLECHGQPAGEQDVTGFAKEGFQIGDIAGAASIVIPLEQYREATVRNTALEVLFFALLAALLMLAVNIAFRAWVSRPMKTVEAAAEKIAAGDWQAAEEVLHAKATGELASLQRSMSSMATLVKQTQDSLEETVEQRTADLLKTNAMLELRHAQLDDAYRLLQQTNDRLQSAIQHKSAFLSTMSHELKTPITSIMSTLALWEDLLDESGFGKGEVGNAQGDGIARRVAEANESLAKDVSLNSYRLLSMVNNILDAAKTEAQGITPRFENVDLTDVLGQVETMVLPLARIQRIDFDWNVAQDVPIIVSDPDLLHRIFDNLANNAIKFTDAGGTVRMRATFDPATDTVRTTISDTGIGIAPENQEAMFEQFAQADSSSTRPYRGSGLGLSVARQMARILNGDITVESELSKGSTFIVELPLDARDARQAKP